MARFKTSITKDGAFFRGDPAKTFRENAHELMEAVAVEGARDVRGQLTAGQASRQPIRATGERVSDYVKGELRKAPPGPKYRAVVFVSTRGRTKGEAVSIMAAASILEGRLHPFRRSVGRVNRARVNLLKGIA